MSIDIDEGADDFSLSRGCHNGPERMDVSEGIPARWLEIEMLLIRPKFIPYTVEAIIVWFS